MSVPLSIYSKCDGRPLTSDTLTITSDNQTDDVIDAVSGKRIIPIWIFIWTAGNNFHVISVGGNLDTSIIEDQEVIISEMPLANNVVNEPYFFNFGINHFSTMSVNTALSVRTIGAAGSIDKVKVGYYLIDG